MVAMVPTVIKGKRVKPEQMVRTAMMEIKDKKGKPVRRDQPDHKVHKEIKVLPVIKDRRVKSELPDLRDRTDLPDQPVMTAPMVVRVKKGK